MALITILLARNLSLYLLVSGAGILVSSEFYVKLSNEADQSDRMAVNVSGMLHFLIGAGILLNHWLWTSLAAVIVTVLGLAFMLRGALYLILPVTVLHSAQTSVRVMPISGGAFLLVGGLLAYLSFIA